MRPLLSAAAIVAILTGIPQAQSTRFEVSSVKPSAPDARGGGLGMTRGRFTATNYTLEGLIVFAFSVYPAQILNAPDWIRSTRYDIVATTPDDGPPSQAMMRSLLAERFSLRVREETREMPAYALTRIRADRLGPGLRVSEPCRTRVPPSPCIRTFNRDSLEVVGGDWSTLQIWNQWSGSVDRRIIDRTGLSGSFDIDLGWNPDFPDDARQRAGRASTDQNISFFTALNEQLGLRLEATSAPTRVVIIDGIQRPTPD
jgi:uncharacterized protein (TIGR03435 family)